MLWVYDSNVIPWASPTNDPGRILSGQSKKKSEEEGDRQFAEKAKEAIDRGMKGMGNEARESKEMARSFFKLLEHKLNLDDRTDPPSQDEIREAVEQLKDVGRLSVFTTAIILPAGAISLMGLELLARRYGIQFTFVPSSFRKNADWKLPGGRKRILRSRMNQGGLFKRKNPNISDVDPIEDSPVNH